VIFRIPEELKVHMAERDKLWSKLLWYDHLGQQGIDYAKVTGVDCDSLGNAVGVTLRTEVGLEDREDVKLTTPFLGYLKIFS